MFNNFVYRHRYGYRYNYMCIYALIYIMHSGVLFFVLFLN